MCAPAPRADGAGTGYACAMFRYGATRRRVLTGLAALPLPSSASSMLLGYRPSEAMDDRGLGLAPPLACTPGTRSQTAGPFYTPATPRRSDLREPGAAGEALVFEGLALTPDCRPVPGAVIDIWHSDGRGRYDNRGFRYRGHQFTDAAGAFRFLTIRPGRYTGRTPHIHVKLQGRTTRVLTTQVYFPDLEAANARDSIFRDDLLLRLDRTAAGLWRGRFDFVLRPA